MLVCSRVLCYYKEGAHQKKGNLLMPDTSQTDHERQQLIAERLISLRKAFWLFIRTFDNENFIRDGAFSPTSRQSLWFYYEVWLYHLRREMDRQLYLDPRKHDELWQQFLGLMPTLYVMITDDYLQDPSRLDLVTTDGTGQAIITERRVTMTMPWLNPNDHAIPADERGDLAVLTNLVGDMAVDYWSRVDFAAVDPSE